MEHTGVSKCGDMCALSAAGQPNITSKSIFTRQPPKRHLGMLSQKIPPSRVLHIRFLFGVAFFFILRTQFKPCPRGEGGRGGEDAERRHHERVTEESRRCHGMVSRPPHRSDNDAGPSNAPPPPSGASGAAAAGEDSEEDAPF
jgi:hypothetical protein